MKQIVEAPNVPAPVAPWGAATKVRAAGNLVFVAGVLSNDLSGKVVHQGDILAQTKQMVKNLIGTLEAAGAAPTDVVKTTTYVVDSAMKDFFETKAFLECLVPFDHPADTLVGVASLAGSHAGQLIEMDAIAVTE